MSEPKYKRILLKIGGEAFAGPGGMGISATLAEEVARKALGPLLLDLEVGQP